MKAILKYMFVGLLSCGMLTACTEASLETAPTDSMSGTGLLGNASAALVPLNGIYRSHVFCMVAYRQYPPMFRYLSLQSDG